MSSRKAVVQRQKKVTFPSFTHLLYCSFKAERTAEETICPKYVLGSMEMVKLEGVLGIRSSSALFLSSPV